MTKLFPMMMSPEDWDTLKELKEKFPRLPEKLKKELAKYDIKANEIANIFAGAVPEGRELLSNALLSKLEKVEKVSYAREIKTFRREVERQALISVISATLKDLWVEKYEKENAHKLFKRIQEFEPLLGKDPHYRDHFVHQFQVFLTGVPIIEMFSELTSERVSNVELGWFLASTFHDVGYAVQQFDFLTRAFFKDFLGVDSVPIMVNFSSILTDTRFLEYIDRLTGFHAFCNSTEALKKQWRYSDAHNVNDDIRKLYLKNLIANPNHGVISALALLDGIESTRKEDKSSMQKDIIFSNAVMSAALAISLHDEEVFQNMDKIYFKKNPLAFLLIYCDTLQEWGRPSPLRTHTPIENYPSLTKFDITNTEVCARLTYKQTNRVAQTRFESKKDEIKNVFKKIRSNEPLFKIEVECGSEEVIHKSWDLDQ